MTLDELNKSALTAEELEEEVDEHEEDTTLEENLQEAAEHIDALLTLMEQIVIVPKGRVIKRLPRDFTVGMEEAAEFLEEIGVDRNAEVEG